MEVLPPFVEEERNLSILHFCSHSLLATSTVWINFKRGILVSFNPLEVLSPFVEGEELKHPFNLLPLLSCDRLCVDKLYDSFLGPIIFLKRSRTSCNFLSAPLLLWQLAFVWTIGSCFLKPVEEKNIQTTKHLI